MWRRVAYVRAAPCLLATSMNRRGSSSPAALALAARTTPALLQINMPKLPEPLLQPTSSMRLLLAGSLLGAVLAVSEPTECAKGAPKRKAAAPAKPAAAKKKAGPALGAVELAMEPEKTFNVEKLIASRLVGGAKEFRVRWQGYAEKYDTWEPLANLANVTDMMAAFDLAKEQANKAHIKKLAVKGRPEGLPCLARMVRQYHSEPGSSAGAERLFSSASRAHHDLKASMGDMSLEHQLLALANTD